MASCLGKSCLRCGACCVTGSNGNYKDCPFLVRVGTMAHCTVYDKRLDMKTADGEHCAMRIETKFDFPGCVYNTNKPIHPLFRRE